MLTFGAIVNICSYYMFGRLAYPNRSWQYNSSINALGIPIGIGLAFWAKMGLSGLWLGISAALFCSTVISVAAVCVTNWDREVLKTRARLGHNDTGCAPEV
jgi:hypothetical protein